MNKVTSVIQETMQKGRAIVSDRKLGKEGYARLGEIYEDGFERIGEFVSQSGEMPELSASWVRASSEIAKLREESSSDGKAVLRRYEAFFKEAAQLAGGIIGGSVGKVLQGVAPPPASSPNSPQGAGAPASRMNFTGPIDVVSKEIMDEKLGACGQWTLVRPAGVSLKEMALIYGNRISPFLLQAPGAEETTDHDEKLTLTVPWGSAGKDRSQQEQEYGEGCNLLLAAVVAEAYRAKTGKAPFLDKEGKSLWVRGKPFEVREGLRKGPLVGAVCSDHAGVFGPPDVRDIASHDIAWGVSSNH